MGFQGSFLSLCHVNERNDGGTSPLLPAVRAHFYAQSISEIYVIYMGTIGLDIIQEIFPRIVVYVIESGFETTNKFCGIVRLGMGSKSRWVVSRDQDTSMSSIAQLL